MADDFGFVVEGDRKVALKFDTFPADLHDALLEVITRDTKDLEQRVKAATPVLTGKLRSEISSAVFDDKTKITGAVFVAGQDKGDYAKAGALEYGAHGTAKVKAHSSTLDHVFGQSIDPMDVMVAAYTRQTNILATKFESGPFKGMEAKIAADLQGAVDRAAGAGE